MKKYYILILCLLFLTGCSPETNNDNNNIENNTVTNDKKAIGNYSYKNTIKCDILNDIKNVYNNYIITNDNQVYLLSIDKIFSNNMNCKIIENFEFSIIINERIIDKQGYEYTNNENNNTKRSDYNLLKNNDIIKMIQLGTSNNLLLLSHNGSIYKGKCDEYGNFISISNEKIIKIENEKIRNFYLDIHSFDYNIGYNDKVKYLITDKSFLTYTEIITNKEECNKYADIACQSKYEWIKNEEISSRMNEFVAVLPWLLINKNGEVFINEEIEREFIGG